MKKTFKLNGLDCANCATKIQDRISKLEGVNNATLNFITTKLIIDGEDYKMDKIIESAAKIINKLEPHVIMKKA